MNFIPIGGWCGTKIALKDSGLFNEPSLPFDSVRSSMEGIIDCIEHNFQHFYPKDDRFPTWVGFIGQYVGFFHANHNLLDKVVIDSFERKIARFDEKIKKNNCIFLRTIVRDNYEDEIKQYKRFQEVVDKKYPTISYIICFIIPTQPVTQYYKNLDSRTFIFTVNDTSSHNGNLKDEYKPIFDFISNENLFTTIPSPNDITIIPAPSPSRFWLLNGYPVVNHIEQ